MITIKKLFEKKNQQLNKIIALEMKFILQLPFKKESYFSIRLANLHIQIILMLTPVTHHSQRHA